MQVVTSASGDKDARKLTVDYNFGENLKESADLFGKELVHNKFISQVKVDLQAFIRNHLKAGTPDKEIQKLVSEWKPGMKGPGKSKVEKTLGLYEKLSDEEKAQLKKMLAKA